MLIWIVIVLVPVGAIVYLTQPLLGLRRGLAPGRVDPARLREHVEMLAETFAPRGESDPDNLDLAAEYIHARLAETRAAVELQEYRVDGRAYRNVVARLGPDTAERVVIGAHYDAAGPAIGADDNASGVAGLIELAAALSALELPLSVELVAYSLEEPPHFRTRGMGSFVHADALRRQGRSVRAMLSLEMIGYFTDDPGSQHFPVRGLGALYPDRGDFIAVVGCMGQAGLVRTVKRAMAAATELPVRSINAPRWVPGVDFSDHMNYWDAGYDAAMITDTAFLRNPHYHEATDTPDTLDYARMAQVVEGVCAAVLELSRDA